MKSQPLLSSHFIRWKNYAADHSTRDLVSYVVEDLKRDSIDHDAAHRYLCELQRSDFQSLLCRSVETTTHLKLSLFTTSHRGLRVWLHVYKPWSDNEDRYAASIHNHRYSFASKILSGGYRECTWPVTDEQLGVPIRNSYRSGDIIEINSDAVHSLEYVEPETVTFIVQFPTNNTFSTVYSPDGSGTKQLYDLESKIERLRSNSFSARLH